MQTKTKLVYSLILASTVFNSSAFAMTENAMMMKDDKMTATGTTMKDNKGTLMSEDKMMMAKEDKMKMMMAITNKSSRTEVAKLQQHLIDEGFLKVRTGTKLGFYGPLTRAAYAKYSASMKMEGDKMMMEDKMMKK